MSDAFAVRKVATSVGASGGYQCLKVAENREARRGLMPFAPETVDSVPRRPRLFRTVTQTDL